MKRRQKALAACVAVALASTVFTGCGQKEETGASREEKTSSEAAGNETASEEPVQLSWLAGSNTVEVDDDAQVVKMLEERFNIDLKGFYVGKQKYQEKLNVKFAAGEMPDVFVIDTPAQLAAYVDGGIVAELPIETIREKAPNYAKCADENDDGSLWSTMVYNGKNYGVANPMSVTPMAMVWNKNWLDNLGLEVPETLEEYEEVLTAFVEQDPDGNGKNDTAGIAERTLNAIFGAYGLRCVTGTDTGFRVEEMQLGEDNVPYFPYIRPEAKEVLELLNRWYEKGIIHKEFITGENHGGYGGLSHLFMNGQIGLTTAQPYHYLTYSADTSDPDNYGICFKEMKALDPNAEIVMGPAPIGPDGKSGTEAWNRVGKLTCITTQAAQDPRKVDAFLAILDAYYADPAYMELANYGLEGIHFKNTEHGRVRIMEGDDLRKDGVLQIDFGATVPYAENLTKEKTDFGNSVTGNGYYRFNMPSVPEFTNVIATLDTLTEQAYFDIITGEKPLDYFDTFVEKFKAAGGETAEKAIQDAYKAKLESIQQ